MRFKDDKYLARIAAEKGAASEIVAVELCKCFVSAKMLDATDICNYGAPVLMAMGDATINEIVRELTQYLYGGSSCEIKPEIFSDFCMLTAMGDYNCPHCGGKLILWETEGREIPSFDRDIPPDYEIETYIYKCPTCGEYTKSEKEL